MFRCCPRIERCWARNFCHFSFQPPSFTLSLSLLILPVDYAIECYYGCKALCFFSTPFFFFVFFFSRSIIGNIVDIVLLSLSLWRNSLLDNMGKQFCGCECGYYYCFFFSCRRTITRKAHSLQCPASHLPLFFFFWLT